ncbi:unnamed protein product (macronuclear) [Paramecium tetraurelia]|uniref:Uncharacterized protein n=1 Tax=Paramecium tetraurelia TaxID=5888 RepID=A0CI27_PARTE|nr:uncharacterized protein GSPATT00038548001 [Paramecium tetraurelia]CAK70444.1 unnamed protein product [Paramecium tetraurelia]|eukprot:XP_001437841.1 hypothetical protein (macronuclear) [Paramecium tetraurelia strain d4-2]
MKTNLLFVVLLSVLIIPISSQRQCRSSSECATGFCCAFTYVTSVGVDQKIVYQTCRNQTVVNNFKNELHVQSLLIPQAPGNYQMVFELTYCITANSTSNILGY